MSLEKSRLLDELFTKQMRVARAELLLPLFEVVKGSKDCLGSPWQEGHYCQEERSQAF